MRALFYRFENLDSFFMKFDFGFQKALQATPAKIEMNKSIKVVIIEDEMLAANSLKNHIKNVGPDLDVVEILDSVETAVEWLSQNKVDLLFLDIHLGDDHSFTIFEKVKTDAAIIFVTAYDQYALRAFKLNSIDYLLKPVQDDELKNALDKFREQKLANKIDLHSLLSAMKEQPKFQERFMVVAGQKIKSIPTADIAFFFSEGRYVRIVTNENEKYLVDHTMDSIEKSVDPERFFRINRQVIVQYPSIKQMHIWSKSRVKVELQPDPGCDTVVSIDRSGEFKKWLNK